MKAVFPERLKPGDEVRVIAPSRSMSLIAKQTREIADKRFEELGLKLSFGKHAEESDEFSSSPIESRISDLHEAFADKGVKAILTVIGGYNSNQLLKYIDYSLVRENPKILCGYSDITALQNAICAKTGLVTYSGPHYSSFGMRHGFDYTLEYFRKCLMSEKPFTVKHSKEWSDDAWYTDQEKREFVPNPGPFAINEGVASGKTLLSNLCTFTLLHGTEFMPPLKNSVLFIEEYGEYKPHSFDRHLQALAHQPNFDKVRGIAIGRFQKDSGMTKEKLVKIIKTKKELDGIPVAAGFDFGHTTPQMTFPIGGKAKLESSAEKIALRMTRH